MQIIVNQEAKEVEDVISLEAFLKQQSIPTNGTAVAINQEIIPKNEWDTYLIKANDNLTIIRATQGG